MSYFDEVIAQRRAEQVQEQAQADSDFQPTATSEVKFKAVGIIVIGLVVCASPFFPAGAAMVIMGLLWLAVSPALASVEEQANVAQKQQQAAGTGQGCAANIWAVFVMAVLLTVGGLLAMAIGLALMGGGQ